MSLMPILVMNGIVLILMIVLAVADRLLVSYGECKITVSQDDERRGRRRVLGPEPAGTLLGAESAAANVAAQRGDRAGGSLRGFPQGHALHCGASTLALRWSGSR